MKIKDISVLVNNSQDFYLAIGDFLDEFSKKTDKEKTESLKEKPFTMSQREYLPFLAATAHKLANDNNLIVPKWVFNDDCYLIDNPFFAANAKGNLRLLFMYKSPAEFKHRNLFVDENVLERV